MPVGFRVYLKRSMPPEELIEAYSKLSTACIADCMGRLCALHPRIKLVSSPKNVMAGAALTVKTRSGDNLMLHKALNLCTAGDILIVANGGDETRSLLGENMVALALQKRVSGIVIDGPVRDIASLYKTSLPIYANGTTPGGPYKEGPGEINVPISCGEISIHPGDVIVGDADGVIVIPIADASEILKAAQAFALKDAKKLNRSKAGTPDRAWVDKTLQEKGCEIINDIFP